MHLLPSLKTGLKLTIILLVCYQCETQTEEALKEETSQQDACCAKKSCTAPSEISEITCPECGHKRMDTLPTDVCVIRYECEECGTELTPKKGDCCVYCTYGTHKCPSMQEVVGKEG